ncbi:MAG: hypothetical protein WCB36_03135 [Burkholderiales bacterium]
MKQILALSVVVLLQGVFSSAFAYEVPTHQKLTIEAFNRSKLVTDPSFLPSIGLSLSTSDYTDSKNQGRNTLGLFEWGANYEDDLPRFCNHFFDLQFNNYAGRPLSLTANLVSPFCPFPYVSGVTAKILS